jgi:hypothetical protein
VGAKDAYGERIGSVDLREIGFDKGFDLLELKRASEVANYGVWKHKEIRSARRDDADARGVRSCVDDLVIVETEGVHDLHGARRVKP